MNWYKKIAQVRGEWWINEYGQALYADDNYSHEGHVIETIMSQYFELDSVEAPDIFEIQNMSVEEFAERGMEPDEIKAIRGQMDARDFAMKNWKWVRVQNQYVQAWILDSGTLKRIADGLWDAGEEAEQGVFVLENLSTGRTYNSVPFAVIEQGNPMALREFQEFDSMALGSSRRWFKQAKILMPYETLDEDPGLWYEAIRLKDGRIIYDEAANHWGVLRKNRQFIGSIKNIESTGFVGGDGVYQIKMRDDEARDYFDPNWRLVRASRNWYKVIIAQNMGAFLQSLGTDPTVIEFILQQEPDSAQLMTNEVRKNPTLTVEQLGAISFPQKSNVDPYLPAERAVAKVRIDTDNNFIQWALVNLRKLRKGKLPPEGQGLETVLTHEENKDYYTFHSQLLPEIHDWYRAIQPEIASFSLEQAIVSSDEWHNMIAEKGEGKYYTAVKPENMAYGPEWEDKEYNGWTVQLVTNKNDMLVEGHKMNHCVGSYCADVERGDIRIYSLRDPQNNPHVTIETSGDGKEVDQIKGNSNRMPDEKYLEILSEWISQDKNSPKKMKDSDNIYWDIESDLDDMKNRLWDLYHGHIEEEDSSSTDEYMATILGLEPPQSSDFQRWMENFDLQQIMTLMFEGVVYKYNIGWQLPEQIDWSEENDLINMLLKTVKEFDLNQDTKDYSKLLINILKEQISDRIQPSTETMELDDRERDVVKSFSQYLLNKLYGPDEHQQYFNLSAGKNWYKKYLTSEKKSVTIQN